MRRFVASILCCSVLQLAQAQQTGFFTDPQSGFKQAKEYYQRGQYSLAYPIFRELHLRLREPDQTNQALNSQELRYYTLACGLMKNEKGALEEAVEYVELDRNVSRVELMSFQLGEYYYRQKDFFNAVNFYEKTSLEHLENNQVATLKFHQGYSYFNLQRFDQAKPLLDAVRQMKNSEHYVDANYYFGFIAFKDKQYRSALESFRVVENAAEYSDVVPYYIATILYITGDKEQALQYATNKLDKGKGYYDLELSKLVGHGWFEKGDYAKALPYLEKYAASSTPGRHDQYELAYSYYQARQYEKSIEGFKKLSGKEDSLAQNAMYLLGDAYLKTGQKANARNAFLFCAINSSNPTQQEISRFNYGKLSYELGYHDIALNELQQFLATYPNSGYTAEAREVLVGVMASTSNYKDALTLLESIRQPSDQVRKFYPGILYGRATELINDNRLEEADLLLDKALKAPFNTAVLPLVQFWKGELAYRTGATEEAIEYYGDYLKNPVSNNEVNASHANYNLGYAYLKKELYKQAQFHFEAVVKTPTARSSQVEQDAFIRMADAIYMQREYKKATGLYDRAIQLGWPSSDYASFQKSMIAGISSTNDKIRQLQQLQQKYPGSSLVPDANMEIAQSYLSNEEYKEAIPYLNAVLKNSKSEALKPRAHLRAGIAQYNLGNNDEALKQYNALLEQYPNSTEAEDALDNARSIYVEEGRTSEYIGYARKMGRDVSTSQQDSLAYAEAEVQLSNGNFTNAISRFDNYLNTYPQGRYVVEANYYKGEILLSRKEHALAAAAYEAVASRVPNKFGEKSLLQAARLNFFDLKQYDKAAGLYASLKEFASTEENKLEAMRGQLRSEYQLAQWPRAVENAKELLKAKGASADDKLLSNMVLARAAQEEKNFDLAISYYRAAASGGKGAFSAEARYEIAWCLFEQSKFKEAEKTAFEVINKSGSYEEWVTRAYLLLGDIYMKQQDFFNAKATYQSIVENASIPALKEEAQRKLKVATEAESKQNNISANN
ncbi:tetratricopeptide repeat protein [Flavihumibacter sp. UBA7668]|uniref:tetratricopeptide repeat protein n=1 Tax=Flavihumibacter sp. UBA7668 TaxID=1946542 RepID=UPI0025BAA1CD|nr:tetratricopeptide repeat protein [Flavihumibacter sp. UBA7668]